MKIDLNCDLGESFGVYRLGVEEAIVPYITSANIACGFHAGDPLVMEETVRLVKKFNVRIGAHPGYPDLQGFGRRNMEVTPAEAEALVLYQIGALAGFAKAEGVELTHVKPHGALYNQASKDKHLAAAIARATARYSKNLILVGLAGSVLIEAAMDAGLGSASEGFPDRAYELDGSLRSRRAAGAVLESPKEVVAQALRLVRNGIQAVVNGCEVHWQVDTLCLHGDNPHAAENARVVRQALETAGVQVQALV
jgi:5-oxoprolinase (ATP-hydrolysing) subunit A